MLMKALLLVLFVGQSAAFGQGVGEIDRLIDREEYTKAMELTNKMISEDPKNEKLLYRKGRIFFKTERFSQAQASFQEGINRGARYPFNHIGVGAVNAHNGNFAEAKAKLDKAKELNRSNQTNVLNAIAEAYLNNSGGEFLKEAEVILYKVLQLDKENVEAFIGLGDLYDRQNVDELALNNYSDAVQRDPKFIKGWLRVGQIKKKTEDYNGAAEAFRKAKEIDPEFPPAYKEMAEMWILAGKFDQAISNYKEYLKLVDNDISARLRYGSILYPAGKYDEAITVMEGVLQDTNALILHRLLGYCYVETGNLDKAKSEMDKYFAIVKPISIIPGDYVAMARIAAGNGDVDGAVEQYKKAITRAEEKEKPNSSFYKAIADLYKTNKMFDKQAVAFGEYLQAKEKIDKKKASISELFALGRAYYNDSSYTTADSVFEVMIAKKEDLHIGWSWRGRCMAQLDPESKEGKAKPYFEKVIELLDGDEAAKTKYKGDFKFACSYMGAYHTLVTEEWSTALEFWNKILEIDPENNQATTGKEYCEKKI